MIYRGLGSGILRATREGVKVDFVNNEKTNEFKAVVWRNIPDKLLLSGNTPDKLPLSGNSLDKAAIKQIVIGKVSMTNTVGHKEMPNNSSIDKMVDILHFLQLNPHSSTELIQVSQVLALKGRHIPAQGVSPVYEVVILVKSCKDDTFIFTVRTI